MESNSHIQTSNSTLSLLLSLIFNFTIAATGCNIAILLPVPPLAVIFSAKTHPDFIISYNAIHWVLAERQWKHNMTSSIPKESRESFAPLTNACFQALPASPGGSYAHPIGEWHFPVYSRCSTEPPQKVASSKSQFFYGNAHRLINHVQGDNPPNN